MGRHVALLRGINVGGNNLIKMSALAECLERGGFTDVRTYIQSGNVLFKARAMTQAEIALQIERILTKTFAYDASVVVRTHAQMKAIVARAPKWFGSQPDKYRYDVAFLKAPLTAAAAIQGLPRREGVDELYAGTGVLYFSRLIARATQSRINKVASMPVYQQMTIRNWNTTTRLLALLDA